MLCYICTRQLSIVSVDAASTIYLRGTYNPLVIRNKDYRHTDSNLLHILNNLDLVTSLISVSRAEPK